MDSAADNTNPQRCDVLVIGGGPAGATISALLAKKGWRVVVLEKERHPRFHIGESLLPMTLPLLGELGLLEDVRRIGVIKYGAEFNSRDSGRPVTFYFSNALDKSHPYAFEVRRSEFDELLLRNSEASGAEVREGVRVTGVEFLNGRRALVQAITEEGSTLQWEAGFLVDASGRDTFLANQLKLKKRNPRHSSAALFGHFKGVARRPGSDEGNISIYWFDHGWLWMIPLRDDVMSIGAVCWPEYLKSRSGGTEEFLLKTIDLCPEAAERVRGATLISPVRATGNYSYQSSTMTGRNFLMIGDAFAFIDPVFSTGVHLAMSSGRLGAEVVDSCLRNPYTSDQRLKRFERTIRGRLRSISWFIYRFTSPIFRRMFMQPSNRFRVQEAVISLLAGDLLGHTPMRARLFLFKSIYYAIALSRWRENLDAYLLRRRNAALSFVDAARGGD